MDLAAVDRSATQGRSWLHDAAPAAKLISLAAVLGAVLVSWNVLVLAGIALALAAAVVAARLPLRLAALLAGYPSVFALIFAFASGTGFVNSATIVAKAVTAALAAVLVVLTTPYPRIFSPLQRVTPTIVGDALLMTYRSAFLLLEKFAETLRAIRLRAGLRGRQVVRSGRAATLALGSVLLYSLDLAQRDYDVLRLRGYEGRLRVRRSATFSVPASVAAIVTSLALFSVALLWRVQWRSLNPWSWLVPLLGLVALLLAALLRWRTR
ncbi:MAG: hypothetical protein HY876_03740 [Coriobacteriales bacterium]|nr:hypothetical protein [Coriobacteriales bacterium]